MSNAKILNFTDLYHDYHLMVRSLLYNMCGDRDLDDLVQEVFLRVWRGLDMFQQRSQHKTWIYRIAINTAYDFFRKNRIRGEEIELKEEIKKEDITLSTVMVQELIQKGLEGLSPPHRAILVLTSLEGLSTSEIADLIEISEGTVKSRLHYARKALLDFLAKNGVTL